MRPKLTLSELTFPFAVVGLAAGWLSAGLLANPVVGVAVPGQQGPAALIAGMVGALIGTLLGRLHVPRHAFASEGPPWIPVALYLIPGGAFTGAAVGWIASGGHGNGLFSGLFNGLICAPAFVPVGALVLSAARRARRARLGSIVAGSDARAIWGIMATALSVTTLAALPDWPARRHLEAALPYPALAMAAGAALLIASIMLADAAALAWVARLGGQPLETHDPGQHAAGDGVPTTDLGLGEEIKARLARGGAAYRSRERAVALLIGSVAEARAALRRALARSAVGLAIAGVMLACHAWAAGEGGRVAYGAIRCAQGASSGCAVAGLSLVGLSEEAALAGWGSPRASARGEELLARGCGRAEVSACVGLARVIELKAPGSAAAQKAWEHACTAGHAVGCRRGALALGPEQVARAASLLRTGCGWGDPESCAFAHSFTERAAQAAGGRPR